MLTSETHPPILSAGQETVAAVVEVKVLAADMCKQQSLRGLRQEGDDLTQQIAIKTKWMSV
jgi:hypothetical protein